MACLLLAIILIKGHKVDFLFLKMRVWFYCENQLISNGFELILVKLLIVFLCVFIIIRQVSPFRARGAVFKVRGPVTNSFEVVEGQFGCSLFVAVLKNS